MRAVKPKTANERVEGGNPSIGSRRAARTCVRGFQSAISRYRWMQDIVRSHAEVERFHGGLDLANLTTKRGKNSKKDVPHSSEVEEPASRASSNCVHLSARVVNVKDAGTTPWEVFAEWKRLAHLSACGLPIQLLD